MSNLDLTFGGVPTERGAAPTYEPATMKYDLLQTINEPADLRKLDRRQLTQLADELREFVIESVSTTGGHLSSNLGTVELTIALHYLFNTPDDRVVWDVGHQTYPHKIITGRREAMKSLRMMGGISGFPKRTESPYDAFGTAHSSTSISAALGMAQASKLKGDHRNVIAVIGDGAMSAGMAFEAMNNAGVMDTNLIVILNDNEMSISPAVGALNRYLTRLMSGPYSAARAAGKKLLGGLPQITSLARRAEEHVKGMMSPSTMFEEFGFTYFGPIDGHDLDSLLPTLRNIKAQQGPRFLHVVTRKGQGYKLAEADPVLYHGVSKFKPDAGIVSVKTAPSKPTFTQIFGDWLCDMAAKDARLVGITPAMREGSGLVKFEQQFPARYFDVGIAEQHAVTFAAGLACDGMKPVVAIYSTFLQRAYDQLIHDVCIQNLPVMFALDRAGLVGADGATHHGAFDLSFLRCLPNMTVFVPADENECRQMLFTAFQLDTPTAVRYPRGSGMGIAVDQAMTALPIGKGVVRREGKRVAILAFGTLLKVALEAGDQLDATVVNMRFAKPLDAALVDAMAARHDLIVTLEENVINGGAGGAVAEVLESRGRQVPMLLLGLPDHFIDHGEQGQLLASAGLDTGSVVARIRTRLASVRP
ncbi:MAG: 1-deoxy-D-xylulose-5-phosphate synthase [Betaproteobacteria bacterium]|nr:1-deoxy-D-xylulose-5-phosphate synthase [Betaproteobacteria bacterium]